ncbi:MAG: nodulation protein NfeD [Acidobacteriota bacterium]
MPVVVRRQPRSRLIVVSRRLAAAAALAIAAGVLAGAAQPLASGSPLQPDRLPDGAPLVLVAHVDALIHPVSAEFMIEAIDRADRESAALLVFELQTPGGLVDATRAIVTKMLAARTPIAVFVSPSGARAASAGFLITLAADIAVMAPGTHIGAAHPVSGQGEKMDETVARKAASDVAAYARTLAEGRGRNILLSEQAVNQSRAFTESEALRASPPLIDLVAADVSDLLTKLDGREIQRFDRRRSQRIGVTGARIEVIDMSLRQRVLGAIAHPNIAYILLSLGVLGLTIEMWTPGAVLPGVAGGLCLLLAFFALQVLPVNYAGALLMVFGLALLVIEIKVASYGILAAGGLAGLLLGSMMLFDTPQPELRVSLGLIVPVAIAIAAITLFLVRLAVASQRRRPVTGLAAMIGARGTALAPFAPGGEGQILVQGETWSARSDATVAAGDAVSVTAVDGLTVSVRLDRESKEFP